MSFDDLEPIPCAGTLACCFTFIFDRVNVINDFELILWGGAVGSSTPEAGFGLYMRVW